MNGRPLLKARAMGEAPDIPLEVVEWLEEQYPPQCIRKGEELEEHLRYAGKVDLVIALRAAFEDQQTQGP